jgi:GAF domain-containing protein
MTEPLATEAAESTEELLTRIQELERERQSLQAVIEILQEISGSLHFVDILQSITRRLGERFGLDRCTIFLADRAARAARLVASYEDPSIRNFEVELDRYPEVKEAFRTGETVFIPEVRTDPRLKHVQGVLKARRVKSICVVPITWRSDPVGVIFLRTFRSGPTFSDADVRFIQVVASLSARALKNAHRYEQVLKNQDEESAEAKRAARRRITLVAFMKRFFDAYVKGDEKWGESRISRTSSEELDRLVEIALAVFAEESKAR